MSGGHSDPEVPEPAGEKAGTAGDGEGVVGRCLGAAEKAT